MMPPRGLTERFGDALQVAFTLHAADIRKGSGNAYVGHLLSVCSIVIDAGGDEDEAIGALLHDALEDHADVTSSLAIEERFGARVRTIVEACTDTPPDYRGGPKPPWRERKDAYLASVTHGKPGLRVSMADKLDNARAVLLDYREIGDALWTRFNAGKDSQLWYMRACVEAFRGAGGNERLLAELDRTVTEVERLVSEQD